MTDDNRTNAEQLRQLAAWLDAQGAAQMHGTGYVVNAQVCRDAADLIESLQVEVVSWKRHYSDREKGLIEAEADIETLRAKYDGMKQAYLDEEAEVFRLEVEVETLRATIEALAPWVTRGIQAHPDYQWQKDEYEKLQAQGLVPVLDENKVWPTEKDKRKWTNGPWTT